MGKHSFPWMGNHGSRIYCWYTHDGNHDHRWRPDLMKDADKPAIRIVVTDENKADNEFHLRYGQNKWLRLPKGKVHIKGYVPGQDEFPAAQHSSWSHEILRAPRIFVTWLWLTPAWLR